MSYFFCTFAARNNMYIVMKKIWYLFAVIFAVMFTACENGPQNPGGGGSGGSGGSGDGGSGGSSGGSGSEDTYVAPELTPEGDKTLLWPALDTTNNMYGYINEKGEIAIPGRYDTAFTFCCGLAYTSTNYVVNFINSQGEIVASGMNNAASPYFTYNRIKFMSHVYTGMWNENFQEVFPAEYERLGEPTADGLIMYRKHIDFNPVRCGYKDMDGNDVLPIKYVNGTDFFEGMASVTIQDSVTGKDLYAVIDKKGNYVIEPCGMMLAPFGEGLFFHWIPEQPCFDLVSKDGKVLIDGLIGGSCFKGGIAMIKKSDELWYFINKECHVILGPYTEARDFFNGLAWTKASPSAHWKAIDRSGKVLVELVDDVVPETDYHNGLSLVKYVQPTFSQHWYLDKEGKVIYRWMLGSDK